MHAFWRSLALVLAIIPISLPEIAIAQSNIGSASSVKNRVDGVIGGQARSLSAGSAVHSNELIRSGDDSIANLVFIDQTRLSVGPKSEVRLDKFVYNPDQRSGAVVIQATRGAYRFATGTQDSRNYQIKTPYATLGVRGTVLEVVVTEAPRRRANRR